jgi:hypothetical protein
MDTEGLHYSRELPLAADYDVVVCGGGPAGCAAGQAVSQVVERSIGFRDVDLGILRAELAEQGAIVDWEQG